jgi:hypothetical protein
MLQFAVSSQLNVNAATKVRTCDEARDSAVSSIASDYTELISLVYNRLRRD